jgi:hypothetical protein
MLRGVAVKTPEEMLRGNTAAALARRRLGHADLAERMKNLGYRWVRQTVGDVLNGKRQLRAGELYGLAIALETSIPALTAAAKDDDPVALPNGRTVEAATVGGLATGFNDKSVRWHGNAPVYAGSARAWWGGDADAPDEVKTAWRLDAGGGES